MKKRSNKPSEIHYFFYIILFTIASLIIITIPLAIFYGNNPATLIVIVFIIFTIVILVIIFASYTKNKTQAKEVFNDLIPCRFGIAKKRFGQYCKRCTTVYPTLVIIALFAGLASTKWETKIDELVSLLGINTVFIIGLAFMLSIPIQATIYALLKKESDKLRRITGVIFSIGVLFFYFYLLNTL